MPLAAEALLEQVVLPYAPPTTYQALAASCWTACRWVRRRRTVAGRRLARWLRGRCLAPEEDDIWAYTQVTKRTLIRSYMARYPEQHLEAQIRYFPHKLQRPELMSCGDASHGGGPRRRLRRILQRCAILEIMYVGW